MGSTTDANTESPAPNTGRKLKDIRRDIIDESYQSDILKALFVSTIIPLVLLEISTAGSNFIDGLFVSQFMGNQALAVQGLASPYFSLAGIIGGLLVTGMQTLSAKAYGKGDAERAEGFFAMAMIVGGAVSVVLMLLFLFACGSIGEALGATGDSADLLPSLKSYLRGLGIGTPALVLYSLIIPIVQMNGGSRMVRIATIVGLVIDTVLDILAGVFGWGMLGIGLATSIAAWTQYLILLVYALSPKTAVRFSCKHIAWSELGNMIKMSLPKAIRRLANMLRPLFLNHLVLALGGSSAMSAMSIRNNLDSIGDVVGSGIAAAVMLLVSVLWGEENRDGILQICRLTIRYIFLAVGAVAVVFFIAAPWLANLFASGDAEVAKLATFAIRCMAVNLVLSALIDAYINFLQATEHTLKTHVVNVASRFACVVICAFVLGSWFGITGVWLAFPVGSFLVILGIVIIAMVHNRSIKFGAADNLDLTPGFGAPHEDTLWYNVTSENPQYPIETRDIYAFCEEHGFDRRKAYRTALCLEEMVTNIMEHGFPSDNKPHSIDIRIVAKNDDLILRIRDDCELFNVREKGDAWKENPDDITENMGIRMAMASAKDLKYVNTLGTNTLIITI